jgi:hypothetical protein
MALISTLTLTDNGTVSMKCKNNRVGASSTYTVIIYGTFGGGTITTKVSADGVTYVNMIDDGSTVTFTSGAGENFQINSDENQPVYLGFTLAGATAPSITIKIYDNK